MAGPWLKMECATPDKPEVLAITAAMGWDDPDLTVGKLFRLWRWFDQHTTDGNAARVTSALLDRVAGVTGFVQAVANEGWLTITPEGISLSNFDRHNGETAKQRAQTAKRVADHKANAKGNADGNADTVIEPLPRGRGRGRTTQPNGCVAPQSVAATPASPKPKRSASGTRLPQDWFLPDTWGQWGLQKYPHFTVEIIRDEATKFANHWRSKTGKDATKLDWLATWQNWLMSDICQKAHPPESGGGETNYQRSMRERVEQAAGSLAHIVAAKAPGSRQPQTPTPWEVAIENNARTTAIGMD